MNISAIRQHKKIFIFLFLSVLVVTAFFVRLQTFKATTGRTIDEIIYFNLGLNLNRDMRDYNSHGIAVVLRERDVLIPDYMTQPLFKHPPLFSLFVAASMKIFGEDPVPALYVVLLFGVLMIPLVYWLGSMIWDERTGLLAAFLVCIDPISVLCSQKVWMDTQLAFFMVLSLALFVYGLSRQWDPAFIFSGLACGLAALTKYPGILAAMAALLYAGLRRRDVLRKRYFLLGMIVLPLGLLLPWWLWNIRVYGWGFFPEHLGMHGLTLAREQSRPVGMFLFMIVFSTLLSVVAVRLPHRACAGLKKAWAALRMRYAVHSKIILGVSLLFLVREPLVRGLMPTSLPAVSEYPGLFAAENYVFYVGRLLEFSLIYLFAYLTFFIPASRLGEGEDALKLSTLVFMVFFSIYGVYQSRYILPAVPLLILLGSAMWLRLVSECRCQERGWAGCWGWLLTVGSAVLILWRSYLINSILSANNSMAYF